MSLVPDLPAVVAPLVPVAADLEAAFARFLRLDVANGDAAADTIRGYLGHAPTSARPPSAD